MRPCAAGLAVAVVMIGLAIVVNGGEPGSSVVDSWAGVRALEGAWNGRGEGFGQVSEVTHEWQFIMGETFLRLETRSVVHVEDAEDEVHEDVGFMSWSGDDSTLRFRQFLSEGFVNTYRVEVADGPRTLRFEPIASEGAGGMLARMTFTFVSDDSYEAALLLGRAGQEYRLCQKMLMQRVR